jgi:hypothetical protein
MIRLEKKKKERIQVEVLLQNTLLLEHDNNYYHLGNQNKNKYNASF